MLITIEGGEGSGKSTLIEELAEALAQEGKKVLQTREPGGCKLSEEIRDTLLNTKKTPIGVEAETLLFLAARAQHVEELIEPALRKGIIVLCDRFNDSTIAYQGFGRGWGGEHVRDLCHVACPHVTPDLTLLLDIDPAEGLARAAKEAHTPDRIEVEELEFHQKVRAGFLRLAAEEPNRIKVINALLSKEEVFAAAYSEIQELLGRTEEAHQH